MKMRSLQLTLCALLPFACHAYSTPSAPPETRHERTVRRLTALDPDKVAAAWQDMARRWPDRFEPSPAWLRTLADRRDRQMSVLCADWGSEVSSDGACGGAEELLAEVRRHLLENPLLDFDRIIAVRRPDVGNQGLHENHGQPREVYKGCRNELGVLSAIRSDTPRFDVLDRTPDNGYIGELCLKWDARKLMYTRRTGRTCHPPEIAYTMHNGRRVSNRSVENIDRVVELDLEAPAAGPTEIPLIPDDDCNCYAGCYLPDGAVLFLSDATMVGVPCVVGSSWVASIYRRDPSGAIRRLTFDQDNSWHPVLMADGRVMFQHWEYADIVHFASRRLYTMNPDGTRQRAYYGTGSFWPNSLFHARPCPDAPHCFTATVSGHHGQRMTGELILFDTLKGDGSTNGVVRRFVQEGTVRPVIRDRLTDFSWPKFAFPYPLSRDYVLVASRPNLFDGWGLYLADAFGNLTPIIEEKGHVFFEATPLQARPRPPILADDTRPGEPAHVSISDIYIGSGLEGVPRGTVKSLRVFTYSFSYRGIGAERDHHGLDGPWDIKRIIGTVPVYPDGSAYFEAPANTPLALQPLDADGCALQTFRSWFNAMPGEHVSCVGCHERKTDSMPASLTMTALKRPPSRIKPWYGPERGLDFRREVQPVLTRNCTRCHKPGGASPDLTDRPDVNVLTKETYYMNDGNFPPSYIALCSYVRSLTQEGDNGVLVPCEAAASTTKLMQMLDDGHHGVRLGPESHDRLVTWIDLNRMGHGAWSFFVATNRVTHYAARRRELQKRYAGVDEDHERDYGMARLGESTPAPGPDVPVPDGTGCIVEVGGGAGERRQLDLGDGLRLELVRIPSGVYTNAAGRAATIPRPFWLGAKEITNRQFRRFMPRHDSGIEVNDFMKFSQVELGYPLTGEDQPAVRLSADQAEAFCRALSSQTGARCRLPTGDEWEWAARAGSPSAMPYGSLDDDFAPFANLADRTFRRQDRFSGNVPLMGVPPWRLADERFDDGCRVTAPVGSFKANAWGLHDMAGNVWEWTADRTDDGRAKARGGSFWSRPKDATFARTVRYRTWQRVHDVGFRVLLEDVP
ncbi:MAG: SUMF1/EgtB/PvdO family nonheme iron enzyme [Kiritimatiellae bacterium]|nr:SUMF1/EgtB/PvdO family nonheme iron enzyme [Kiritimatiellia bacterium]